MRGQGNRSGRSRLRTDATHRAARYPRGLILSTGEDIPKGQSLRGRILILELAPGKLNFDRLTVAQKEAADGLYAQALSGYLQWLAPRYEQVRQILRQKIASLRAKATTGAQHRRTPDIVASLAFGWQTFLEFALGVGAITPEEQQQLWDRGWTALCEVADAQQAYQSAAEPTRRFLELLGAAIAAGSAHIAGQDGGVPAKPEVYGWRKSIVGSGDNEREEWRPQGTRTGWIDGDDLYLDPDASYTAVQRFAHNGEGLTITSSTLHRRLKQRGLLKTTDETRERLVVRRTLAGARRKVLHLAASHLLETAQTAQSPNAPADDDVVATEEGCL